MSAVAPSFRCASTAAPFSSSSRISVFGPGKPLQKLPGRGLAREYFSERRETV